MAFAEWDITTITTNTQFGAAAYWVHLPEAFAPIGWVMTTTPLIGENEGLWERYDTTSVAAAAVSGPMLNWVPRKVLAYMPGTQLFRCDQNLGTLKVYRGQLRMFYRSINEVYQLNA